MLRTYLNQLTPPELADSVENTVNGFMEKLSQTEPKIAQNVLLLGNVQSGKTAQVLGILSALADDGDHKVFLYLTTDSVDLQEQTVKRAEANLKNFIVLSENDDRSFMQVMKANNPILVVIKKNARVLKRWRNLFASQSSLKGYPLVIVDDEADAASLNTNTDKPDKDASTINKLLNDIKNSCCQSLFIQLTATPQSLLLQHEESDWQPEFIHFFEAGEKYIGGNFVFSDPPSYIVRFAEITEKEFGLHKREPADKDFVVQVLDFAEYPEHTSVDFGEGSTIGEALRQFLRNLPEVLPSGHYTKGTTPMAAAGLPADFAEAANPDALSHHERAVALAAKEGISYEEAARRTAV